MTMPVLRRLAKTSMLFLSGAATFQYGIGSCRGVTDFLNPCGSIFAFCTAEELDRMNNPIPDYENDPSCTIPGACGDQPFPTGPGPRPGGPP